MEKRIELEKRGRAANQITELNLDNCRSTNIVGLSDEYTALETLSLINVGLTSLKGFPKLPNLKKLELSDNRITNGLNNLHGSPKLTNLNLSGNKIKDLDELKALAEFKNLAVLDLFNNEVTAETEQYRETIFNMIPSLVYLDGYDANDVECVSEGEDGEDEDELNGNDSDEDGNEDISKPFFINGMEIDLGELEEFEKRLNEKRQQTMASATTSVRPSIDDVDELDEYLDRLALDIQTRDTKSNQTDKDCDKNDTSLTTPVIGVPHNESNRIKIMQTESSTSTDANRIAQTSLPLMLFGIFSILLFINTVVTNQRLGCSDVDGEDEGESEDGLEYEEDDDDEDDDGENGDVSLSAVYDDNLDEENSDEYVEEVENEESDAEDDDDDDDEAERSQPAVDADEAEGESEVADAPSPRGTKRKHEDEVNDG